VSINSDGNNASYYVYILIHTISVKRSPTMKVNIHNQCSDYMLLYLGHFGGYFKWDYYDAQEIDSDSMRSIDLTPDWAVIEGSLVYKLERKHIKSNDQPEPMHIQLSIFWKSEGYRDFCVFVHLRECNRWPDWDEFEVKEHYQRHASQLCTYTGPIRDTWLISGDTVLMTELKLDFTQRDGVLNIAISEGIRSEHTKIPEWVYLNE
jgi:hypothetical protein